MDIFRFLIFAGLGAYVFYRVGKLLWHGYEHKHSTATTQGKFVYSNYRIVVTGRQTTHTFVPVYEYRVDGRRYQAEIELQNPDPMGFIGEAEVEYDPADPTVCFIWNKRGKILFQEELEGGPVSWS